MRGEKIHAKEEYVENNFHRENFRTSSLLLATLLQVQILFSISFISFPENILKTRGLLISGSHGILSRIHFSAHHLQSCRNQSSSPTPTSPSLVTLVLCMRHFILFLLTSTSLPVFLLSSTTKP